MIALRRVVLAAALAVGVGCSQEREAEPVESAPAARMPEPIGEVEAERGVRACDEYAAAVCAKAEADPAWKGECELAGARPAALEMNLRVARAEGDLEPRDKAAVMVETRKIAASCLEDLAKLSGPAATPPGR